MSTPPPYWNPRELRVWRLQRAGFLLYALAAIAVAAWALWGLALPSPH